MGTSRYSVYKIKGNNCAITSNSSRFIPQLRYKLAYLLAGIAEEVLCRCDVGALMTSGSDIAYALYDTLQVQNRRFGWHQDRREYHDIENTYAQREYSLYGVTVFIQLLH